MGWYNGSKVPQWKQFITKPFTTEGLLLSKELITKEIANEVEVQEYLKINGEQIVRESLFYCLQYPKEEDSYDRRYLFPTKAVELLTNDHIFFHLGWGQPLIKTYIHLLLKYFKTVDPHYQNINLYHGYFERLLKIMIKVLQPQLNWVIYAIDQEERSFGFVGDIMKHCHKHTIISCCLQLLSIDIGDNTEVVDFQFKRRIFEECLNYISRFVNTGGVEFEKVENCLFLLKMFLEQNVRSCLNKCITERKAAMLVQLYQLFINTFSNLISILKSQQTCLKMAVIEVMQINQVLLRVIKTTQQPPQTMKPLYNIDLHWVVCYHEQIITCWLSHKFGIVYPLFLELLIIICANYGQNPVLINLICKTSLIEVAMKGLISHKENNILGVRVLELLKVMMMNMQKQIIFSIESNKAKDTSLIQFQLFQEFFRHLPIIQDIITSFKNYNERLFTLLIRLYKVIFPFVCNIDSVFNYYNLIPVCSQSRPKIVQFMDFYKKQTCFQLFQNDLSKELGDFFDDKTFKDTVPTQFSVIRPVNVKQAFNPLQMSGIQLNVPSFQADPVEIKLKNDLTDIQAEGQDNGDPQVLKPLNDNTSEAESNQPQQSNESYTSYMQKKMKEAGTILTQRRSKSRTPTKIKNQIKKSKNKWTHSQVQNEENEVGSVKGENVSSLSPPRSECVKEELPKIVLLRISSKTLPKVSSERGISYKRDSRLCSWLKLVREVR